MTVSPRPRLYRRFAAFALPLAALASAFVPAPATVAAPEPAPIPRRWQLDIETSPLRSIVVDTPGIGPRAYFFITFKVTNNSAHDVLFAPAFELATDDMALLRSGRDVPVAVTNEIKDRLQNPLLEDQISVVGTLLRGPENAKDGLVIWPIPAVHQSEVTVYCAGFSGETAIVEVPAPTPAFAAIKMPAPAQPTDKSAAMPAPGAEATPAMPVPGTPAGAKTAIAPATPVAQTAPKAKTEKKVLRKTLMLRYRLPGDLRPGQDAPMAPIESRWIMR